MTPEQLENEAALEQCLAGTTWDCDIARKLRAEHPDEPTAELLSRIDAAVDAEIDRQDAEKAQAEKAAAERKALGVAAPLGDWLDSQPEPVTMRQMRETPGSPAFGKAQPTVHHWLTTLQTAQRVRRHHPTEMRWSGKK
jgi:hypothetical protein